MTNMNRFGPALGLAALLALGGCDTMNGPGNMSSQQPIYQQPTYQQPTYQQSTNSDGAYSGYGVVQAIELMRQDVASGSSALGLGTLAGAVVGGIVGNQIGSGGARPTATVLGAASGAYVGHQMEKRGQQAADAYKFTIRMNNGSYQTLMQSANPDIRVGDRVQIDNGVVRRY